MMNEKLQELIRKELKDKKRGATYRSGMVVEDCVPTEVKELEERRKRDCKSECRYYGCDKKNHRTRASKKCLYHTYKSLEDIEEAEDRFLRQRYPQHYGELRF